MARTTKVYTGTRTPDIAAHKPQENVPGHSGDAEKVKKAEEVGARVYRTRALSYSKVIKTVPSIVNPVTGEKSFPPQKNVVLQRDRDFVTSDPEVIKALESSSDYGLDKSFWRVDEQLADEATQLVGQAEKLFAQLENTPEMKAKT